jgi:hypothetical protein
MTIRPKLRAANAGRASGLHFGVAGPPRLRTTVVMPRLPRGVSERRLHRCVVADLTDLHHAVTLRHKVSSLVRA